MVLVLPYSPVLLSMTFMERARPELDRTGQTGQQLLVGFCWFVAFRRSDSALNFQRFSNIYTYVFVFLANLDIPSAVYLPLTPCPTFHPSYC